MSRSRNAQIQLNRAQVRVGRRHFTFNYLDASCKHKLLEVYHLGNPGQDIHRIGRSFARNN